MKKIRIGIFRIGRKMIDVLTPDIVRSIFGRMIILEAVSNVRDDNIWYVGLGDMFDEIEVNSDTPEVRAGQKIPEYECHVKWTPDGESGCGDCAFHGWTKTERVTLTPLEILSYEDSC